MERVRVENMFSKIGARVTIRKGTSNRGGVVRMNVTTDRGGEHFTLTIHPDIKETDIDIQMLDYDEKLRQMLLFLRFPRISMDFRGNVLKNKGGDEFEVSRLLVGHDEMHWFVAGVTESLTVKQAFERLRPAAVTVAMRKSGVKDKNWRKRKNKGFIRQGEWFFVPVHFEDNDKTIIHKNEPIRRPNGGKPHFVEEVVRFGGEVVYVKGDSIITEKEYKKITSLDRLHYRQQVKGATVIGRGKVKHPDHHTVELKGWHEIHLSTEAGVSTNAFID